MPKSNGWDAHPRLLDYKGRTYEFFTRGAFAKAINRQVVTIRSLEDRGVLCTPRLQDKGRHWLYTRSQIEDLIELTTREGAMDPKSHRPFSENFIKEAHAILNRWPDEQ